MKPFLLLAALFLIPAVSHAACGYVNGQYVCINNIYNNQIQGRIGNQHWSHTQGTFGNGSGRIGNQPYRSQDLGGGYTRVYHNGRYWTCNEYGCR